MRFSVNHDLHCHTGLSLCSNDPKMTPEAFCATLRKQAMMFSVLPIIFGSDSIPDANEFYQEQGLLHVSQSLPLPESQKVRFLFGCETEYCGEGS